MRLNYRYTIAYTIVIFFVLLIGMSIIYTSVKRSASQATIRDLKHLNQIIADQILSQKEFSQHPSRKNITIKELQKVTPKNREKISYKTIWNDELQDSVTHLKYSSIHKIRNKHYQISSHTFMIIADNVYLNGIFMVLAWTFIFLISAVIIASEIISSYILSPFNSTLQSIQKFAIHQKTDIHFEKTSTLEFQELNDFLLKMTRNAKKEYLVLKEFSENASHELQTPIAVIKAKIELLMQSDLDKEQLIKITSMHDELEKLSKINQSLTLLIKLENFQNQDNSLVNISTVLEESLVFFSDLIEMKNIHLESNIEKKVVITMDETLCLILLNNLISNAIRHNITGGEIKILLTATKLVIKNTGEVPLVPTIQLFERFKKNNQSINSIGIGLAIVKKICEIFNHPISYTYKSSYHKLEIIFDKNKKQA